MATLQTTHLGCATRASPHEPLWKSFATRITAFIRKRIDEHRARPLVTRLDAMAMSDHELRDIGLRRADVEPGWDSEAPAIYALTEFARFDHF